MADFRCFVVDAFTRRRFAGNPAGVVPLESWPADDLLQSIAAELNHAETAFFGPDPAGGETLRLRWFTPTVEVDLCGHATLAAAFVSMTRLDPAQREIAFATRSGRLSVSRSRAEGSDELTLDFPSRPPVETPVTPEILAALGAPPRALYRSRDLVAVYESAAEVRALRPDLSRIAALKDTFAVSVTAPGGDEGADADVDFVSRFFAPAQGVPEDPVTGSAHCSLAPLWAARLGKRRLRARQVGRRGGELTCAVEGDRVALTGNAVLVLEGTIHAG